MGVVIFALWILKQPERFTSHISVQVSAKLQKVLRLIDRMTSPTCSRYASR